MPVFIIIVSHGEFSVNLFAAGSLASRGDQITLAFKSVDPGACKQQQRKPQPSTLSDNAHLESSTQHLPGGPILPGFGMDSIRVPKVRGSHSHPAWDLTNVD